MQTLAVCGWLERGGVFARRRWRDHEGPLTVHIQVPLLDADMWQGLPKGHIIRSGIELDRRGQRVSYSFLQFLLFFAAVIPLALASAKVM